KAAGRRASGRPAGAGRSRGRGEPQAAAMVDQNRTGAGGVGRSMKIALFAALALAGAALAGVVAQAGGTKTGTVRVTEREYKLTLSSGDLQTGQTRFEIKNTGKMAHRLAIAGKSVNAKTKLIKPGKSAVLVVNLKQGSYSIWCPVPGHAAKGMK